MNKLVTEQALEVTVLEEIVAVLETPAELQVLIQDQDPLLAVLETPGGVPGATGPTGPQGPAGPQGPPGDPGAGAGDKTFSQAFTNLDTVIVVHNLGKYPSVTVFDSTGDEVDGNITYNSNNQLTATFSSSFTGTIICN